ncbi:enoyl-CoA hydratase/isomerase family protein [Thermodesulfobacteriota bacterium B35]
MESDNEQVLFTRRTGRLVYLVLNRPGVHNALSRELLLALRRELELIRDDPGVDAVFFTGAGERAFSAGADIGFLHRATPLDVRELALLAISVTRLIEELGRLTIALINGFALGGGLELAEACMLRIASREARMGHPEVRIGAVAGWGGTTRLPRLIGRGRATEMLLTGEIIDADEALRLGLVNRVVEGSELRQEGERLAGQILDNSPVAVRLTWEAILGGQDAGLAGSLRLGADCFGLAAASSDFRTGTAAFLNREKARFHAAREDRIVPSSS